MCHGTAGVKYFSQDTAFQNIGYISQFGVTVWELPLHTVLLLKSVDLHDTVDICLLWLLILSMDTVLATATDRKIIMKDSMEQNKKLILRMSVWKSIKFCFVLLCPSQ